MSDSAFRRLLLDTVETIIAQPPSSSSLIELLRIATPKLLAASSNSKQWQQADAKVRIASQREKLFKKLQLRIHPDKHAGDERATKLFQDVTSFYGSCVDAMGREDTRRRWSGGMHDISGGRDATTKSDHTNVSQRDEEKGSAGNDNERNDASSSPKYSARWYREQQQKASSGKNDNETSDTTSSTTNPSQFAQWFPWWDRFQHYRLQHEQNPRRPTTAGASSTHSDYENCDNEQQQQQQSQYDPSPIRRKNNARRGSQPSSHQCCAVVSTILFPPFGLCALYHSFQVRRAWIDGRYGDARDHSDQAYSYAWFSILIFACLCLYLWSKGLGDGDGDEDGGWDWDEIKKKFGWDDGP
mmetsp:Transcript_19580/g.36007  ORF Transcript_19580/g.36007 Transcript_19580/m.36007 type:complete len:356 (+) Transcript_19580:155-1222(+)